MTLKAQKTEGSHPGTQLSFSKEREEEAATATSDKCHFHAHLPPLNAFHRNFREPHPSLGWTNRKAKTVVPHMAAASRQAAYEVFMG